MANLQQTYSGDLTSALAGTIAKKVLDAARKEKKGPVAKAQAEMEEPDDSFPVKDIKTRELAGKILGSTVEQKLNVVEFSVKQLKNEVSALNSNLVQSHQLIYDQNLMLGAKFDQLLDHFTANRELQEEISEDNKVKRKELELEKSNDLSDTLKLSDNKNESSSGGGGNITNRVLSKILGRLSRGKFKGIKSRLKPLKSILKPKAAAKVALKKYAAKGASKFGLNLGVKGLSKGGAKIAAKKLPFGIGLAISSVFAAQRLFQNPPDPAGAALELASGAAAFVPGIGTAGSLAIDAGLAARDMSTPQYERGTGFAKKGYSVLHGMEALVTKKDSSNFSDTMMLNQDNQISYFASSVQSLANRTGTGREISSIIKKSGLDYKFTNIPFASDVGNIQQAATVKQPTEALLNDLNRRDKNIVKAVNNTSDPDDPTNPNDPTNTNTPTTTNTPTNTPLGPRAGYSSNGPLSYPKQNKRSVTFFKGQGADASGEHGVDFSFNDYNNNYAIFAGEVISAGKVPGYPGYGNAVQVRSINPLNPNDTFESLYAHFPDNGMAVRVGDKVKVGDYLGKVGWNGVRGPGGDAAMQGNGAGNMSGPHTSLDFYSSNGGGWHPDASALTNLVIQMEGKVPTGYTPPIKQSASVLPSSNHQGPVINGGGGIGGSDSYGAGLKYKSPVIGYPNYEKPKDIYGQFYARIYKAAKAAGDPFPEVVAAQAVEESDFGRSTLAVEANNLFGQDAPPDYPSSKKYVYIDPEEGKHTAIKFDSFEESVRYRVRIWKQYYGDAKTPSEAIANIASAGYNPHAIYPGKINAVMEEYGIVPGQSNPTANDVSPTNQTIFADKVSGPAGPKGLIKSLTDEEGFSGLYMKPINFLNPFDNQSKLNEIERISSSMEDMEDGIPVQTVVVTNTIIKNQNNTRISSNTSKVNPVKSYQLAVLGA